MVAAVTWAIAGIVALIAIVLLLAGWAALIVAGRADDDAGLS